MASQLSKCYIEGLYDLGVCCFRVRRIRGYLVDMLKIVMDLSKMVPGIVK